MTWEREGGMIREVPGVDRHVFEGSIVRLTLAEGESLVIGPTTEASHQYLLGHRFLVGEREGRALETILFVTPRSQRTRREVRVQPERP